MKTEGKGNKQIASVLGISENVVSKVVGRVRKKLGIAKGGLEVNFKEAVERAALAERQKIIAGGGEFHSQIEAVNQAMAQQGFPERVRAALVRRLRVKHGNAITPAQAASDEDMKRLYREKIGLAFTYMDDKALSEASFRDLSVGLTAMTEKLQLLEGKPTQIISDLERKRLHELLPLLAAEAQRRGITLDGQVLEKDVTPA